MLSCRELPTPTQQATLQGIAGIAGPTCVRFGLQSDGLEVLTAIDGHL